MNLSKLSTSELLNYSTILENIISTNLGIQREMNEGIQAGFCTEKEISKILNKSKDAHEEADGIYLQIQKELDLRVKKDLGMKFGITRSQSIIKELDMFIHNKNLDMKQKSDQMEKDAQRIAQETEANLKIVEDDKPE